MDHWLSFCWLPPFSLPSCPFCSATPSSSSASSRPRPRPRPRAFSSSDQNPSNRSRLEGGFTWPIRSPLYLSKMPRSCTWGKRDEEIVCSLGSLSPLPRYNIYLASHRNFRVASQFISQAYLISPTRNPYPNFYYTSWNAINIEISLPLHLG